MNDLVLLLPILVVGFGALLLMLLSTWEKVSCEIAAYLSMFVFGLAFIVQLIGWSCEDAVVFAGPFSSMLKTGPFACGAGLIICGCGFFLSMSAHTYLKENVFGKVEFYALAALAASGMLLLTMAAELITAFIALEIMSLAIYVLVGFERRNVRATEAVLKYLMLGAFAGAFFVMGIALIYGGTQTTRFAAIAESAAQNGFLSNHLLVVGIFLVCVALLFKLAAFPFHAWVVDVYDGSSMPVTGFMATALKTAVLIFFVNLVSLSGLFQEGLQNVLYWIVILTLFGGNLVAIGQNTVKRMLAASGIVHTGYLLIMLVAFTSLQLNKTVILYYLLAYATCDGRHIRRTILPLRQR